MNRRCRLVFTLLLTLSAFFWTLSLRKRVENLSICQSILEEEKEYRELKDEEQRLYAQLYRPVELCDKEAAALALGMDKPRWEQLVCAESVLPDRVTVLQPSPGLREKIRELFSLP